MKTADSLTILFQQACAHQFDDFNASLAALEAEHPLSALWEAYLMRAQIKLFLSDETALADLNQIAGFLTPHFPPLGDIWQGDTPNRFIVFSKAAGALTRFVQILPAVQEKLKVWFGEPAAAVVRQLRTEILYFCGDFAGALALSDQQPALSAQNPVGTMLAHILKFRCCLALGQAQKAEAYMLDIIRASENFPKCIPIYKGFRSWANLTTNWCGETPRFRVNAQGEKIPVLDDRIDGVRIGMTQTTPLEAPFVKQATRNYPDVYELRKYYVDLLHVFYWFQAGENQQANFYFVKLYETARNSGVITPIIECGEQIVPLLRFARNSGWAERDWTDDLIARAKTYEKGLRAYQNAES